MQTQELSADQKAQLQRQAQDFEAELGSNAGDLDALEGAGVSYAQLGDFKRAEGLLAKLTNAKPDDAEAWRLLVPLLPFYDCPHVDCAGMHLGIIFYIVLF